MTPSFFRFLLLIRFFRATKAETEKLDIAAEISAATTTTTLNTITKSATSPTAITATTESATAEATGDGSKKGAENDDVEQASAGKLRDIEL